MNFSSLKTRFSISFLVLLLFFLVQIPIVYSLVGSMGRNLQQIDVAGGLRKRVVEISYVLTRHILTNDESLDPVFYSKKKDFEATLTGLREGAEGIPAVTDPSALIQLKEVEKKWKTMNASFNKNMEYGDGLTANLTELNAEVPVMIGKLNKAIKAFVKLNDSSYGRSINLAGLQRMRTVKLGYLTQRYFSSFDEAQKAELEGAINKTINNFEETLMGLEFGSVALGLKKPVPGEVIAAIGPVKELWKVRKATIHETLSLKDHFDNDMRSIANEHTPSVVQAATLLNEKIYSSATARARQVLYLMIAMVCVSAGLVVFFLYRTSRKVIAPIQRVEEMVKKFAKGDLTGRVSVNSGATESYSGDEVTSLSISINAMADSMSDIVGRIGSSSSSLGTSSSELDSSSSNMSDGVNAQSAQAAQVATAMEEMNAAVIEVARNSHSATEAARGARDIASKGGDVVGQAINAMKEVAESTGVTGTTIKNLGKSSEEIGTIISVINDIADQTNLLALNAAIEAARAGEQGRGFAVVADEVRKLAERTTKATKEIGEMINTIQDETTRAVDAMDEGTNKVENGVKLANEAGDALSQIVTGVEDVNDMISQIATAAEEQSATAEEIARSMENITEASQTNVDAITDVSGAAGRVSEIATELHVLVDRFVLTGRNLEDTPELKLIQGKGGKTEEQADSGEDFIHAAEG
ncbi:MAG: methyl-accepting chemotaxis protein [Thermodesulfobacteriota bacterium]